MRLLSAALLWLSTTQALSLEEKRGNLTLDSRDTIPTVDELFPFKPNDTTILDDASTPSDAPGQNYTVDTTIRATTNGTTRQFIEATCDAGKVYKIRQAWDDAARLSHAQTFFRLDYDFNTPHTDWLGDGWNYGASKLENSARYEFRNLIGNNFIRLKQLFDKNAQSGEYIFWYCNDHAKKCTDETYAYTWNSINSTWSNHYTVLCPKFFDSPILQQILNEYKDNELEQKIMENFQTNSGLVMYQEIWHYKNLVSRPPTGNYAYGAKSVYNLARNSSQGINYAYVNAGSYAFDAMAIYVQQYYNMVDPPVPDGVYSNAFPGDMAGIAAALNDTSGSKVFNSKPSNWTGPIVKAVDNIDLSIWKEITPPTDQPDSLNCGGSKSKWLSRDKMNSVIPLFCAEAEAQIVQDKDSGSTLRSYLKDNDLVNLSIDWPSGDPWRPTRDECHDHMTRIMDGCDTSTSDDNPFMWKHGGSLTSGVAKYNIVPQVEKYTPGQCAFHLHEEEFSDWNPENGHAPYSSAFFLRDVIKDGSGAVVSTITNDQVFGLNGADPYVFNGFYAPLEMTPEAANDDYIQFKIGDTSWTTKNDTGPGRCTVGDWDGKRKPVGRDMDCFFPC